MRAIPVLICTLALLAATAGADITVMMSDGPGDQGEFHAWATGQWPIKPIGLVNGSGYFETFCVERSEYFSYGSTYYVTITDAARAGGGGAVNGMDPICQQTQYLYDLFIHGNLTGYNYGDGPERVQSADALQNVFWYLEDEFGIHADKPWQGGLAESFYQIAMDVPTGFDGGGVRVMNLYGNPEHSEYAQDQLVEIPIVPLPGAVLLGGLGLSIVGLMQRRRIPQV